VSQATTIEWTDVSWNPVHGCSRVSTGCKHCYAETLSLRYRQTLAPWTARNAAQNVLLKPHKLREPLSKAGPWKKPCRVFVNSMSDLFHEEIPDEYIDRVFATMALADRHTFQVLTKRPERARAYLTAPNVYNRIESAMCGVCCSKGPGSGVCGWGNDDCDLEDPEWPLPNVWLGVSIENRKWVRRADVLRQTPAAVRFISAEPLLGPLIAPHHIAVPTIDEAGDEDPEDWEVVPFWDDQPGPGGPDELDLTGIDWLIVGGESGQGHRPFDVQWARDLRDVSQSTGTAFFVKQLGGARPGTKLEDLPEDLRIREFPA
jgi:protein gp37